MLDNSLFEIQVLAKTNKKKAEKLIADFISSKFSLSVKKIKINSSVVSLNSVNGFIFTDDEKKYFFKFHAEENEEKIVSEYYKSNVLSSVFLPTIEPIFSSNNPGEQFLIYPFIKEKTFFDELDILDNDFLENNSYNENLKNELLDTEKKFDEKVFLSLKDNLKVVDKEVVEKEEIWQLFYRRLVDNVSKNPRLKIYYENKNFDLPNGEIINFDDFANLHWEINGNKFDETLSEIIESAKKIINPNAKEKWVVSTAHGDDHNGNKFIFRENGNCQIKLFDPAFASENIPILLACVKTTFHDIFAHPFWLYESEKIKNKLKLDFEIKENKIKLTHNFDLKKISPIRFEILKIKFEEIWYPLFKVLEQKNLLQKDYKNFIKKALFCCPFLVFNLLDRKKYSPKVSLLAFAKCVEMGTYTKSNLIDDFLDNI